MGTAARCQVSHRDGQRPARRGARGIDVINADWLRAVLGDAAGCGHGTFVMDMTHTRFCASAGLPALVQAHNRAVADAGELRLVLPARAPIVRRVFEVTGIDGLIPTSPT